jgi:hypothetical protein
MAVDPYNDQMNRQMRDATARTRMQVPNTLPRLDLGEQPNIMPMRQPQSPPQQGFQPPPGLSQYQPPAQQPAQPQPQGPPPAPPGQPMPQMPGLCESWNYQPERCSGVLTRAVPHPAGRPGRRSVAWRRW